MLWLLRALPQPTGSPPSEPLLWPPELLPAAYAAGETLLGFDNLGAARRALLAAVGGRDQAALARQLGAPDELFAQMAGAMGAGAQPAELQAAFTSAFGTTSERAALGNAGGRYSLQAVPRELLLHEGRPFTAHTYLLVLSAHARGIGSAAADTWAGPAHSASSGAAAGAAAGAPRQPPESGAYGQLFLSSHAFLSMLPEAQPPSPGGAQPMSDAGAPEPPLPQPLLVPLTVSAAAARGAPARLGRGPRT